MTENKNRFRSNSIPEKLIIQSDGKLVLQSLDDRVAWSSHTDSYECVNGKYINEN